MIGGGLMDLLLLVRDEVEEIGRKKWRSGAWKR